MRAAHLWNVLTGKVVFGTTPGVGRVFVRCRLCGRVVPAWQVIISKRRPGDVVGCRCGSGDVQYARISWLSSAYWVLVRGVLIRRVLRRSPEWDPRIPYRPLS
jgi:hypothetical protein